MSEWINVKDKLPEDDRLKIIRYGKDGGYIGFELSRYYVPSNLRAIGKKWWCFEFGGTQGLKVSHWADLPMMKGGG